MFECIPDHCFKLELPAIEHHKLWSFQTLCWLPGERSLPIGLLVWITSDFSIHLMQLTSLIGVAVKLNFQQYIRRYISRNEIFEYSYPLNGAVVVFLLYILDYGPNMMEMVTRVLMKSTLCQVLEWSHHRLQKTRLTSFPIVVWTISSHT